MKHPGENKQNRSQTRQPPVCWLKETTIFFMNLYISMVFDFLPVLAFVALTS